MTPAQDFACKLTEAREAAGLSKSQLAAAAGINPAQVCRYEKGAQVPSVLSLYRLAAALKLGPHDLIPSGGMS